MPGAGELCPHSTPASFPAVPARVLCFTLKLDPPDVRTPIPTQPGMGAILPATSGPSAAAPVPNDGLHRVRGVDIWHSRQRSRTCLPTCQKPAQRLARHPPSPWHRRRSLSALDTASAVMLRLAGRRSCACRPVSAHLSWRATASTSSTSPASSGCPPWHGPRRTGWRRCRRLDCGAPAAEPIVFVHVSAGFWLGGAPRRANPLNRGATRSTSAAASSAWTRRCWR
eukprot:scaffold394_cov112-Isochrysis_galbana.AAC.6